MSSLKFILTFFFTASFAVTGALSLFTLVEYRRVSKALDTAMVIKPHPYVPFKDLPPSLIKIMNEVEYPQSALCNEWSAFQKLVSDTPSLHLDCKLSWELIEILMPPQGRGTFIKGVEDQMAFIRLHLNYSYDQILEQVINRHSFGNVEGRELGGFQNASTYYFKRNLNELSLEQVAGVVVVSRNPTYYHPVAENRMYQRSRTFLLNLIRPQGAPAY
ncbi:transglycosylase domain-containing protein [Bdellovibrio sp. GT3]|uniref:transglycosylase domain-containing protein n=1 Tax=Bdellovibrio sp. GT3 TaxID=3136282 RepID=UPI0030EFC118